MSSDSIISNTISEDIKTKGHQSIRLMADGFSILISDAGYAPVYLEQFRLDDEDPKDIQLHCRRILKEKGLLDFEGETVLIMDTRSVTLLPKPFYQEEKSRDLLQAISSLEESDIVHTRYIKNRSAYLVFATPEWAETLSGEFKGEVNILHVSECLISLADQVRASDHQRGIIMAEVQEHTLDILSIKEDRIVLINRYVLNDPSDFVYHVLNTVKQLNLDREKIPVYLSGIVHQEHELFSLLGKYLRAVKTTPYYLEGISRKDILRFMILSEGSKCV